MCVQMFIWGMSVCVTDAFFIVWGKFKKKKLTYLVGYNILEETFFFK